MNWNIAACCVANLLFYTAIYVLIPVLPLYLVDEFRAEEALVGVVLSLFLFAAMVVRPFSGPLVDSFRRKPLYLLCYFLFTAHFVGYLLAGTLLTLALVRAMHGLTFSIATTSATTPTIVARSSANRARAASTLQSSPLRASMRICKPSFGRSPSSA